MHCFCNFTGVVLDGFKVLLINVDRRQNASWIPWMDTCKFDMLHYRRNKCMNTVTNCIGLAFKSMLQEAIDQNGTIRSNTNCRCHIAAQGVIVIHHFHTSAAKNIARTNHDGISNFMRRFKSILNGYRHSCFWHRNTERVHHLAESVTILRQIDNLRTGA